MDAREKVESGRDLVCVAVRCTGGEHIVMRAVSRVRYGRVTVASDREQAERRARASIYIGSVVILYLKNFPKIRSFLGAFSQNTELFSISTALQKRSEPSAPHSKKWTHCMKIGQGAFAALSHG